MSCKYHAERKVMEVGTRANKCRAFANASIISYISLTGAWLDPLTPDILILVQFSLSRWQKHLHAEVKEM